MLMLPGPGLYTTFLYYFSSATLIVAIVSVKGLGIDPATGLPLELGILMGLIAGGIGTYFNRTVSVSVPSSDLANSQRAKSHQTKMLKSLDESLTALGYEAIEQAAPEQSSEQSEDYVMYGRSGLSALFSGKVFVQATEDGVTIAGRARQVKQLRQQLAPPEQ